MRLVRRPDEQRVFLVAITSVAIIAIAIYPVLIWWPLNDLVTT